MRKTRKKIKFNNEDWSMGELGKHKRVIVSGISFKRNLGTIKCSVLNSKQNEILTFQIPATKVQEILQCLASLRPVCKQLVFGQVEQEAADSMKNTLKRMRSSVGEADRRYGMCPVGKVSKAILKNIE